MTDAAGAPDPDPTPEPAPDTAPTPAPAPDPAPDGGTAGDGGEPDGGNVIWPENWQSLMAGGDKKVAEEMGRYAEPGLIGHALVEAKNKIRSMDVRTPFPDEGSTTDQNKWRKDNGIPKEAAGYLENLPDGLKIAEEDKQGMDTLAEAMHASHAPANFTHAAMGAYYKHVENILAEQAERDAKGKKDTDDALHELYGGDFRRNVNDLGAWLDSAGEGVKAKILSARAPDGMELGNDPEFLKFMIGQMRLINPLVTVPGLGGSDPAAALEDEIAAIEKTMRMDNKAYRADKAMQGRYLELLAARDKHK